MRVYRPTSTPAGGINHELLQQEVSALGNIGVSFDSQGWRFDIFDESVSDAQAQAVVDAHDATQLTAAQEEQQRREGLAETIRDRIVAEIKKETPDWASLYNDARDVVIARPGLQEIVQNLVDLHDIATGSTTNTSTNAGKATYLEKLIEAITLYI